MSVLRDSAYKKYYVKQQKVHMTIEQACMKKHYFDRCCCTCAYQKPIVAHPWNDHPYLNGSVRDIIAYGCNCPEFDCTIMFDTEHGMCEMHQHKEKT